MRTWTSESLIDGIANSGDDDGEVDYVFLMLPNVPLRFIIRMADGIAQLGFDDPYVTADHTPSGEPIRISGQYFKGLVAREGLHSTGPWAS